MTKRKYKLNPNESICGNDEVAPTLTTKPKTVVLAKKKRKTAISIDAQEGGGSKRMPIPKGVNEDFDALVGRIQATSDALQQDALVVINRSVTTRAWLTGYYIVEYEQHGADRAKYGEGLLKKLAARLNDDKFRLSSLKSYRQFFRVYPELAAPVRTYLVSRFGGGCALPKQIGQTLSGFLTDGQVIDVGEKSQTLSGLSDSSQILLISGDEVRVNPFALFNRISFSHIIELLKMPVEMMRTFYAFEAIRGTWSVRALRRQIESQYYQRVGWAKNPHKLAALAQGRAEKLDAKDFIKQNTVLEFLGLKPQGDWDESDLERGILDNLKNFIREMGTGFCFEDQQQNILIDDVYERIDLVFYHRILKCHVLIELKPKKLNYKDIAQLSLYISYYRKNKMTAGDNPPIGILLCTGIGKETAEYLAPFTDPQLFLSEYQLQLPTKEKFAEFLKKENEGLQAKGK